MRAPLPDPCYNCIPAFIQNTFIIIQKTLLYTVPSKNQKRYTILLKDPNEQPLKSRKQCVLMCPPYCVFQSCQKLGYSSVFQVL